MSDDSVSAAQCFLGVERTAHFDGDTSGGLRWEDLNNPGSAVLGRRSA